MRVAWPNNREFHTQFHPKKLNDWREGRTLILVKRIKASAIARAAWQCRLQSAGAFPVIDEYQRPVVAGLDDKMMAPMSLTANGGG